MTVDRWDPMRDMVALQDRINRAFDDTFQHRSGGRDSLSTCAWRPVVDIYESEEGIVIQAELPGVCKENVALEVKDNILTLKGERTSECSVDDERYYCKERCFGSFRRMFNLEAPVDPEGIKARFKDGVLTVSIPKPEEDRPRQIPVHVE